MIPTKWEIMSGTRPTSVDQVVDVVLGNRSLGTDFFHSDLKDLEAYLSIAGMDEAAELMAGHIYAKHKIVLVGDYDCDGITSAAQVSLFLREIGYRNFEVVIPTRTEGYGMPERAVIENPDASLFLVMDCGTLDVIPVSRARNQGSDCIVIDHHEVPALGLAPASTLINPKQPGCPSGFKEFCSAGLTLLFLLKLRKAIRGKFSTPKLGGKYLALAAIGTVADLAPLVGANRIFARSGLSCINARTYAPIQKIIELAGLDRKTITSGHLGYYLGPRINAAGRMADPGIAYDLMVSEDPPEITRLANELNRLNSKRQSLEDIILCEVRKRYASMGPKRRTVITWDSNWPVGLVGIIASRIQQEIHYGPTIVFSVDEAKGLARGSARSIPGFDIYSALESCDDLLVRWGGHKMAAGMTIRLEQLEQFAERFETITLGHPADIFICKGRVDLELDLDLISNELLSALKHLEPHGLGNPVPVFAARGTKITYRKIFGKDRNHIRIGLNDHIHGIFWRGANHNNSAQWGNGEDHDIVFNAEWDDFYARPVLNIKDIGHLF
ncbi:MAG: single-stranded-DNA-specific exonuclease RecJ [Syntrophobacteraceae bacterium]